MKLISLTGLLLAFLLHPAPAGAGEEAVFEDINDERAAALIAEYRETGGLTIIDARTPREFAGGRIHGAVNIPSQAPEFRARLETLDREAIYLVYCAVGARSRPVLGTMRELGFRRVFHLAGGLRSWQAARRPLER